MSPAKQPETHSRSIYIDVELTFWEGSPPPGMKQEIIEIGIVEMDLVTLGVTRDRSYFIRPRRWEISTCCANLTGITKDNIQSGRPFVDVLTALTEEFAPSQALCCAWGDDAALIAATCHSNGFKTPLRNLLNLAHLFQHLFALKQLAKLSNAVQILGLDFDGVPHGALADARNTARVHAAIIRRMRREPDRTLGSMVEPTSIELNSVFSEKLRNAFTSIRKTTEDGIL